MLKRHFAIVNFLRVTLDVVIVAVLWNAVYFLRFSPLLFSGPSAPSYKRHLLLTIPIVLIIYICRLWAGIYQSMRIESAFRLLRRQIESLLLGYMFIIFFLYYTEKVPYTRVLLFLFFFVLMGGILTSHSLLLSILRYFRSKGYNQRHYAIIGTGKTAIKLHEDLQECSYYGLRCVFFIDNNPQLEGKRIHNIPAHGDMNQLQELVKIHQIDEIYLAQTGPDTKEIYPILEELQCGGITIRILPDWSGLTSISKPTTITIGSSVLFTASDCPLTGTNHILKDVFDRLVAFFLLCLFAVPMLVIAIIIKCTSPGPVFYKQKRIGMDQRIFNILKFRTMEYNPKQKPGWTVKHDPRRTAIGGFLRSTSIDELPQLFNVLKGDMSLVGPRPEQPYFVEKFSEEYKKYMFRHKVKSGMTGWAQIHGFRGDTSLRKRIQYDINYIQNWSIWLDLLILIRTPFHIIKGENAQ